MCMFCKGDQTINTTTSHVVTYKDCVIVIRNVPCEECTQCGEKFYSNDVALRLDDIVAQARQLMQEVSVMDYCKVA